MSRQSRTVDATNKHVQPSHKIQISIWLTKKAESCQYSMITFSEAPTPHIDQDLLKRILREASIDRTESERQADATMVKSDPKGSNAAFQKRVEAAATRLIGEADTDATSARALSSAAEGLSQESAAVVEQTTRDESNPSTAAKRTRFGRRVLNLIRGVTTRASSRAALVEDDESSRRNADTIRPEISWGGDEDGHPRRRRLCRSIPPLHR